MTGTTFQFPLTLNGQNYFFEGFSYGQTHLYPKGAGYFIAGRIDPPDSTFTAILHVPVFDQEVPIEKLHHSQVESHYPTHILFYQKRESESLLGIFNLCQEAYPGLVSLQNVEKTDELGQSSPYRHTKDFLSSPPTNINSKTSSMSQQCSGCCGSGRTTCSSCGGMGGRQVMDYHIDHNGMPNYQPKWESCMSCSGGYVNCSICGGKGQK